MQSFVVYCTILYNIKQNQSKIVHKTIQFCVQNQTIMNKHVQKSGFFAPGFATIVTKCTIRVRFVTYCLDCSFCNNSCKIKQHVLKCLVLFYIVQLCSILFGFVRCCLVLYAVL